MKRNTSGSSVRMMVATTTPQVDPVPPITTMAISVTERTGFVQRVRRLSVGCAKEYVKEREALGFPLLKRAAEAPRR